MFSYLKARRAAKAARRQYELVVLQNLIDSLKPVEHETCKWCEAMETAKEREGCEQEFARG